MPQGDLVEWLIDENQLVSRTLVSFILIGAFISKLLNPLVVNFGPWDQDRFYFLELETCCDPHFQKTAVISAFHKLRKALKTSEYLNKKIQVKPLGKR